MNDILDQKGVSSGSMERRPLPNATATLVLGILAIVLCFPGFILGIIAMVLHKKDKALYESNPMVYEQSYKNAKAGYICAIIGTCTSLLVVIFYTIYFIFMFSVLSNISRY